MAHHTVRSGHESLVERLHRLPQGAPPSHTLYSIPKLLFSEKEAGLVALLPIRPFTTRHATKVWKMHKAGAQKVLNGCVSHFCNNGHERLRKGGLGAHDGGELCTAFSHVFMSLRHRNAKS